MGLTIDDGAQLTEMQMGTSQLVKTDATLARRSSIIYFLATALFFFSSSAATNDGARALKPIIAKGDTWTYRTVMSLGVNRNVMLETITATFINEAADTILASVDRRPEGAAENPDPDSSNTWTLEWNGKSTTRRGHVGMGGVSRPHSGLMRFPKKVGDIYERDYEIATGAKEGPLGVFNASRKSRVTRWEQITVPAGTFKAIVIETEVRLQHIISGGTVRSVATFWYSPEVRRWVKSVNKGWPDDSETELLSYKLIDGQ